MNKKTYFLVSGIVFLAVATLHFLRNVMGWDAAIGGWAVPVWVSWATVVVAGFLAFTGLRLSKKA